MKEVTGIREIIKPENLAYKKSVLITDKPFSYCPGCGHGTTHRILAEVLEEAGMQSETIGVAPVGCSVLLYDFMDLDIQQAAHGSGPAGKAFQQSIDGLGVKGDKKKLETVINNRDSYWTLAYNDGIAKIGDAQRAWPEYNKKPQDEADQTLWGEAQKSYDSALKSLTRASLIRPGHAATLRSLGSVYVFKGDPMTAQKVFENALKVAPGDTNLIQSLQTVRQQYAETLIDEKKYDEAIKYFDELIKASPGDANLYLGLGSAYFGRAQAPAEKRN